MRTSRLCVRWTAKRQRAREWGNFSCEAEECCKNIATSTFKLASLPGTKDHQRFSRLLLVELSRILPLLLKKLFVDRDLLTSTLAGVPRQSDFRAFVCHKRFTNDRQ